MLENYETADDTKSGYHIRTGCRRGKEGGILQMHSPFAVIETINGAKQMS